MGASGLSPTVSIQAAKNLLSLKNNFNIGNAVFVKPYRKWRNPLCAAQVASGDQLRVYDNWKRILLTGVMHTDLLRLAWHSSRVDVSKMPYRLFQNWCIVQIDIRYDSQDECILITGSGRVEIDACCDCWGRLMNDPGMPDRAAILIDGTGLQDVPAVSDVRIIEMMVGKLQSRFCERIALVASMVGLVSLFHLIAASAEGDHVQAFHLERLAREWLKSERIR